MPQRIDCKKAERDPANDSCRWCGRPVKYDARTKRYVHRRGFRRIHPDPRK